MAYEETKERKAFEEHIFNRRFHKGITRVSDTAQFPYKVDCPSPIELFEKDGRGDYKDLYISAMWFGWSELAQKRNAKLDRALTSLRSFDPKLADHIEGNVPQ